MRSAISLAGRHLVRQLRTSAPVSFAIVVVCLAAAIVLGAVPRLLATVSEDDLRHVVARAEPEERNIRIEASSRIDARSARDPFFSVARQGEQFIDDDFPPSVRRLVVQHRFVVDSPRFRVASFPDDIDGPFPTSITLRHHEGIQDHVQVIDGRMPEKHSDIPMLRGRGCSGDPLAVEGFVEESGVLCAVERTPVIETAITATTAEIMGLAIGDTLLLRPDGEQSNWFGASGFQLRRRAVMVISGIVELSDPEDPYWFADTALHRPRITESADYRLIFATGIPAEEAYGQLLHLIPFVHFDYTWRYQIDPDGLQVSTVGQLKADLDKITPSDARVVSGLAGIIDDFLERRRLSIQVASTAVFGLAALAAAVVVMLALLLDDRLAAATTLTRYRGASRSQLVVGAIVRATALVIPASAAGFALAVVLVPGAPLGGSIRAVASFAAGAIAVLTATTALALLRASPGAVDDNARADNRLRRLVFEGLVAAAAFGAVLVLRRRDTVDVADPTFDLLLAATPVLVALGVGVVALRVATAVGRVLAWAGGRLRALSPLVGFRRLSAHPFAARVPAVVMIVGLGVAIFSMIVHDSVEDGRRDRSYQVVGADLQVAGQTRGATLLVDPDALRDVRLVEAAEFPRAETIGAGFMPAVHVLALDSVHYRSIGRLSAGDQKLLDALDAAPPGTIGAIVSAEWAASGPPVPGSEFGVALGRGVGPINPTVTVVGVVDRFPILPENAPFIIVDLAALRDVDPTIPVRASLIFAEGERDAVNDLQAELAVSAPAARVLSRYDIINDLAGTPLARWSSRGLLFAAVVAAVVTAGSGIAWVALTAPARSRDIAILNTVGLRRRQGVAVVAAELAPLLVIALAAGTTLGITLAQLLAPTLDIEAFTGQSFEAVIVVVPMTIAVVVASVAVLTSLTVATFVVRQNDASSRRVLRVGDSP